MPAKIEVSRKKLNFPISLILYLCDTSNFVALCVFKMISLSLTSVKKTHPIQRILLIHMLS